MGVPWKLACDQCIFPATQILLADDAGMEALEKDLTEVEEIIHLDPSNAEARALREEIMLKMMELPAQRLGRPATDQAAPRANRLSAKKPQRLCCRKGDIVIVKVGPEQRTAVVEGMYLICCHTLSRSLIVGNAQPWSVCSSNRRCEFVFFSFLAGTSVWARRCAPLCGFFGKRFSGLGGQLSSISCRRRRAGAAAGDGEGPPTVSWPGSGASASW